MYKAERRVVVVGIVLRYPRRSRLGGSRACVPGNVAVLAFLLKRRKLGLGGSFSAPRTVGCVGGKEEPRGARGLGD